MLLYLATGLRRWISHVHLITAYADRASQLRAEQYWNAPLQELAPVRGALTRLMFDRADAFGRMEQELA